MSPIWYDIGAGICLGFLLVGAAALWAARK